MAEARRYPIWPDYNAEAEAEALARVQANAEALNSAEALTSADAFAMALRHAKNIAEDLVRGNENVGLECLADDGAFSETLTSWLRLAVKLRLAEAEAEGSHWRWHGWPDYVAEAEAEAG